MNGSHWIVAPIVLPLLAGALALLLERRSPRAAAVVSICATLALVAIALRLLGVAADGSGQCLLVGQLARARSASRWHSTGCRR